MFAELFPIRHPLASFWLVMVIICVAPLVASRFRLPGLAGTILGGALVGPSALRLLERNATIELLGSVGLLYLIFVAGLTLDLNQFLRQKHRSIVFGLLSFGFPFALAYWVSTSYLGFEAPAAILLGSILGTHTLIAFPIVQRLGVARDAAVVMVVGATLLTDGLGLLVLAGVVRWASGSAGVFSWIVFGVTVALYLLAVLWGVPRLGRWFFRTFPNRPHAELAFVLAVLFGVAVLAELAGLAAIVGAFLTGLAMNRLIPSSGPFMNRIVFIGDSLFIPFFLVSVGLLIDFRVILGGVSVLLLAVVLLAILAVGKSLAALLATGAFRLGLRQFLLSTGLSVPQAAATLAVTLIGYDQLHLFDERLVNAVVVLILLSCLAGSWLVEKQGRAIAESATDMGGDSTHRPQRILLPLSNPQTAPNLVGVALALHEEASEEPLYPLVVAPAGRNVDEEVARAEAMLLHATQAAAAAAVPASPLTRVDLNVAEGICRAIAEIRASSVVIGWNGDVSARERIFGRVLDQLLDRSTVLVLVCRLEKEIASAERVVVAVPPLSHRLPGFPGTVRAIKLMADRLRKPLVILTPARDREPAQAVVDRVSPKLPVRWDELPSWPGVVETLAKQATTGDLVLLVAARQGALSWYRGLDRLPGRIAQALPQCNFVALYPAPESDSPSMTAPAHQEESAPAPRAAGVLLGVQAASLEQAARALLDWSLPSNNVLPADRRQELLERLVGFQLEIGPGVVLLHASLSTLSEPKLLVCVLEPGIEGADADEPVRVVLVLLSPTDFPAQRHLSNLAWLAQRFSQPAMLERLLAATAPEEAVAAFTSTPTSAPTG
ncbi:MAG: cation:proton antiporter [Candidatus Sumerlaeia bacterium]|nr:cation:proton antiporter [Candidatus Sumerlaeia bacterium]